MTEVIMKKDKKRLIGLGLVGVIIAIMMMVIAFVGQNIEERLQKQLGAAVQDMADQNSFAIGKASARSEARLPRLGYRCAHILPARAWSTTPCAAAS